MKKIALAVLLALTLVPAASFAQVVIRIGPPAPVVPGRWERPPRPGARWVAHRWVHRHGEWVLIEGHWR